MTVQFRDEIEFMGGPLDGQRELKVFPLDAFLGVRTFPSSKAAWLLGAVKRWMGRHARATLVPLAVYELSREKSRTCYHYLGTQAVTHQQLRSGCGLNTVVERFDQASRS